jgi:hypothetical protein
LSSETAAASGFAFGAARSLASTRDVALALESIGAVARRALASTGGVPALSPEPEHFVAILNGNPGV